MYTIKEVADKMEISEHTLRFWAKSGFFPFVKRNKNSLYAGGKENEWRSIIWRRRWSAGARGAPLWPLPPI